MSRLPAFVQVQQDVFRRAMDALVPARSVIGRPAITTKTAYMQYASPDGFVWAYTASTAGIGTCYFVRPSVLQELSEHGQLVVFTYSESSLCLH